MQNLSNYSNSYSPPQRNPTFTSIQNLQNYITELTLYINENNHKYNKNMHTLKQFYEAQISELQSERNEMGDEIVSFKNQVITAKDIIANKNKRISELQNEIQEARESAEDSREKLMIQRRKIDQIYSEMNSIRLESNELIENSSKKSLNYEAEINHLNIENKQKDSEILSLNEKLYRLEDQLSERYSLPDKIKQIQKENDRLKTALDINKRRLVEVEEKMDYTQAQIDKYRKENESLRIMKGKYNAQKSLQIQKTVKQQRDNAEHRLKKLENENQSYIYQLNESSNQIKGMKQEIEYLGAELNQYKQAIRQFQKEIKSVNQNKDAYIAQFGQLKVQYEGVIQRLQDSLIDYQKKNWNLEQENKELNEQLQSLQELLQEVKAINTLQPARRQYRKLAEMQVIASRPLPKQQAAATASKMQAQTAFQSDYANDWQKLLQDIQKIKI